MIYDRGTLKSIGGLSELKNAVTSIDNDNLGEFPNLIAATENKLYVIRRKRNSKSLIK
jgi:hypothetical protein